MIDNAERHMLKEHRIHLTIHYDPIVTDNAEVTRLKEKVGQILGELDPRLTYHDFRMVEGPEHTNLIFDVVLPYDLQGQEKRLQEELNEALQEPGKRYYTVITFDMESFNQ
jgi:hypothetical protein